MAPKGLKTVKAANENVQLGRQAREGRFDKLAVRRHFADGSTGENIFGVARIFAVDLHFSLSSDHTSILNIT